MKMLVVTSCTGEKLYHPDNQLTQADFADAETLAKRERELAEFKTSAGKIYTGMQHQRLMEGIETLRSAYGKDIVDLYIVSAGYGLISEDREVVPYEVTFNTMNDNAIKEWSQHLGIHHDLGELVQKYDLVLFLLGDKYLKAVALPFDEAKDDQKLVFFASGMSRKMIPSHAPYYFVEVGQEDAKSFSYGLVGLKGYLWNNNFATTSQTVKNMKKLFSTLTSRWDRYQAKKTIADSNVDFAKKLNSSTGLSLQRYVLGIMLTSITVAANQLLKTVRSGRYQLYRSYESSGNARKAGLELDVLDTRNGEKRSVTTLSGGEKFLLALSLAIGLSTVVQAQSGGTKLDAMFIDEGFGSLDSECIDDAMSILQGIQKSHGLVGIISHVEKLSEIIPTRLEVVTSASGNHINPIIP